MKFRYIGQLKDISALNTPSLKLKELKRSDVKIAIIDDEPFEKLDLLKQHEFNVTKFDDVEVIDTLQAYDIILCDIKGVGIKFNPTYQGAYLMKEIYKKYPFKTIIAYTGIRYDARYNEYLKVADFSVKKDVSSEEWVEKLDKAVDLINNPRYKWERIKKYLLEKDVPLFSLALLEDEYVERILTNKGFHDFPSNRIKKQLDGDVRAVLQSLTANLIFYIITG